jgi:hypothetical protein
MTLKIPSVAASNYQYGGKGEGNWVLDRSRQVRQGCSEQDTSNEFLRNSSTGDSYRRKGEEE